MLLTVCLFTFNHKKYIEKAIESVLMQRTSFNFKLLISDDCSTDGTSEICAQYKKQFPDKIKLISRTKNVGMRENIMGTLLHLDSDYVALLEGDDYWIDPLKLEKQYCFLIKNTGFSLCFHNAIVMNERSILKLDQIRYFIESRTEREFNLIDLLSNWTVPTASMMYKNTLINFPDFSYEIYNWDWLINLLCAHFGKVMCLAEPMSIYRINDGGNTSDPFYLPQQAIPRQIELLKKFNVFTQHKYDELILNQISIFTKELRKEKSIFYRFKCRLKKITKQLIINIGFKIVKVSRNNK